LTFESIRRFDGVLTDCHMPVLGGWQATRRWRAQGTAQPQPSNRQPVDRLPIIDVTTSAAPEDRQACLDAGMNEHLPKPFYWAHLEGLLRRFGVLRTTSQGRP
jgi:two-component system sensor histidine kinase/response regulator